MASYRNTYENFYTDKQGSYVAIGAIVPVLANKHTTNSTETGYTPPPNIVIEDPHFCQKGFLYCDGEEYDITSYPTLYNKIANNYNDSIDFIEYSHTKYLGVAPQVELLHPGLNFYLYLVLPYLGPLPYGIRDHHILSMHHRVN